MHKLFYIIFKYRSQQAGQGNSPPDSLTSTKQRLPKPHHRAVLFTKINMRTVLWAERMACKPGRLKADTPAALRLGASYAREKVFHVLSFSRP